MPSAHEIYIPTEVLIFIAQALDQDTEHYLKQQGYLYNFCLVSRQWYSAGIAFLYHFPHLYAGDSFAKFTNTVCPPVKTKSKNDLGSLVHVLHLHLLTYHSSKSLTARLLNRVRANLAIFTAPKISFAVNSLSALSKCRNLVVLDLSLVMTPIEFSKIKKAISHLDKLECLRLPVSTHLTNPDVASEWPNTLSRLEVGGTFDLDAMPSFSWPPALISIHFQGCHDLNTPVLEAILQNPQLAASLKHLIIHRANKFILKDFETDIIYRLPNLISLKVPVDLLEYLLILPPPDLLPPLPLMELELTAQYYGGPIEINFSEALLHALSHNLPRLCALGLSSESFPLFQDHHDKIDELVWKHADKCPEEALDDLEDLGIYMLHRGPI